MTKTEQIFDDLRAQIILGVMMPGHHIVVQPLAEYYGTSAVPVRQALKRLNKDGLIDIRVNSGAFVAQHGDSPFEDEIATLAYLEGITASLSIQNMTDVDIDQLEEINNQMIQVVEDQDQDQDQDQAGLTAKLNFDFHDLLSARCPNQHLLDLYQQQRKRAHRFMEYAYPLSPTNGKKSAHAHRDLLQLIRESVAPAELETWVRQHRLETISFYEDIISLRRQRSLPFVQARD